MASRKMKVGFGLMNLACRREGAVQAATELKNLCVGQSGKDAHAPTALKQDPSKCPECGDVDRDTLVKGHGSAGAWTIVSAEDQAALEDVKFKGADSVTLNLVPHPSAEFLGRTDVGDGLYYVWPEKEAAEHYALLVKVIDSHPELAFVGLFALSAAGQNKLWHLRVREGVIVMEERTREQALKPLPDLPEGAVNEALLGMVEATLDKFVVPYDASAYEDAYETAVQAAVAAGTTPEGTSVAASDADIMAKLAELAKGASS